jgi:hypothetical protein
MIRGYVLAAALLLALPTACSSSTAAKGSGTPNAAGPSLAVPAPASGAALLTVAGKAGETTQKLTLRGPWTLAWAYDCSGTSGETNFQIFPTDTDPNVIVSPVNELTGRGSGAQRYSSSGTFYFIVKTLCYWRFQVSR